MSSFLFLFLSVLVSLGLVLRCTATLYIVGDTSGWDISTNLDTWPIGKTFKVGDVLLFQYSSLHSVYEVSKEGYDNCDRSGALVRSSGGNTTIPLSTPGDKYFICGTPSHCLGGMKFQVSVTGAGAGAGARAVAQDNSPASAPHPQDGLDPSSPSRNPLPSQPSLAFRNSAKDSLLSASFCVFGALLRMIIL